MRNFFIMLLVGMLGFGLAVDYAEARRLGGGKSFGSVSRSADSNTSTPARQAAPAGNQQGAAASRPGGMMAGMFGGMLAGGLLAALFFGGAFDELRLMDIVLIAGLAFLLFRLLARRRPAVAGGDSSHPHSNRVDQAQVFRVEPLAGSFGAGMQNLPDWFDKERFLGGAKEHFMTLQRAWDNNDFAGIQDYVTPELYNLLRDERARQPANNRTEIVRLFAELGDVREYDKVAEASVIFHGLIDENGQQGEFNETWHLKRDMQEGAPWYIQGIEQNAST